MKSNLDDYIIQKVKQKRIEKGLSQRAFADNLNLSQSFIAHVENPKQRGKYNINHINGFARFFDCSLYEFLPEYPID
jgi:transcriptional regulator with XRE-family HTH domain